MTLTLKHAFAATILMLSLAVPAAAGPFDDATAAYGRGDYATALRLLRPLADQRNSYAQFNLGLMYAKGQGVPQDYVEAVKWFHLTAEQDHVRAEALLGSMYSNGQGVRQDYAEAVKWYRRAAEHGNSLAEAALGIMYMLGQGTPQDYVSAYMWFNLAAAQGDQRAAEGIGVLAQYMTPAQITEAQKLAREWKPTKQSPR